MLTDKQKYNIYLICKKVCDILSIVMPEIVFERNEFFSTTTTMALTKLEKDKANKVYIDPSIEFNPSIVFVVAHELRHVYQSYNQKDDFETYVNSADTSNETYNLQFVELDANAFGIIMQQYLTGTRPVIPFNENIRIEIYKREIELINSELSFLIKE